MIDGAGRSDRAVDGRIGLLDVFVDVAADGRVVEQRSALQHVVVRPTKEIFFWEQ